MWSIREDSKGYLRLTTPYNPEFVQKIKGMGGRWESSTREWVTRAEIKEQVEEAAKSFFGDPATGTVDLIVAPTVNDLRDGTWFCYGLPLARRLERDSSVRLADNAAVVEGHFPPSCGSRKNPVVGYSAGIRVRLFDVPADLPYRYPKTSATRLVQVIAKDLPVEPEPELVVEDRRAELLRLIEAKKNELKALIDEYKALDEEETEELVLEPEQTPMEKILCWAGVTKPAELDLQAWTVTDLKDIPPDGNLTPKIMFAFCDNDPVEFSNVLKQFGVYAEHCRPMKNLDKWFKKLAKMAIAGKLTRRNKRR